MRVTCERAQDRRQSAAVQIPRKEETNMDIIAVLIGLLNLIR
jgi:hypothetical protein